MSSHDRTRRVPRGMMRALGGAAVLGGALPAVLSAQPAMASAPGCYGDCQPGVVRSAGLLKYDTLVGVNDQITVSVNGGFVTVTNPASTLTAGSGCTLVTSHEARCQAATSVVAMSIRSLDGDDSITNATGIEALIRAGDGNDRLIGGSGEDTLSGGFGSDVMQGGGGTDTVTYLEVSDRLGVRADLDGATGDDGSSEDGPAGARDTIAADVENLVGTGADDVLIGNAGPNIIDGSGGRDQLQGLGGNDDLTARGAGTINGGVGTDHCTSDVRLAPTTPDAFIGCERTDVLTS
jgi:Ca2+-binding RTX toxin-like protein